MTTNHTARHIATKKVVKHMNENQAKAICDDLLAEGWIRDKNKLTKPHEHEGAFVFKHKGNRYFVSYMELEVAS